MIVALIAVTLLIMVTAVLAFVLRYAGRQVPATSAGVPDDRVPGSDVVPPRNVRSEPDEQPVLGSAGERCAIDDFELWEAEHWPRSER